MKWVKGVGRVTAVVLEGTDARATRQQAVMAGELEEVREILVTTEAKEEETLMDAFKKVREPGTEEVWLTDTAVRRIRVKKKKSTSASPPIGLPDRRFWITRITKDALEHPKEPKTRLLRMLPYTHQTRQIIIRQSQQRNKLFAITYEKTHHDKVVQEFGIVGERLLTKEGPQGPGHSVVFTEIQEGLDLAGTVGRCIEGIPGFSICTVREFKEGANKAEFSYEVWVTPDAKEAIGGKLWAKVYNALAHSREGMRWVSLVVRGANKLVLGLNGREMADEWENSIHPSLDRIGIKCRVAGTNIVLGARGTEAGSVGGRSSAHPGSMVYVTDMDPWVLTAELRLMLLEAGIEGGRISRAGFNLGERCTTTWAVEVTPKVMEGLRGVIMRSETGAHRVLTGDQYKAEKARVEEGRKGKGKDTANTLCFNCEKMGHFVRECPEPRRPRGAWQGKGKGQGNTAPTSSPAHEQPHQHQHQHQRVTQHQYQEQPQLQQRQQQQRDNQPTSLNQRPISLDYKQQSTNDQEQE